MDDPGPATGADSGAPERDDAADGASIRSLATNGLRLTSETWRENASERTRTRAFWSGPAVPELVPQARHAVTGVASTGGVAGSRLADVRTCVSEAVANAVMHAFPGNRTAGTIAVSAEFSPGALTLVVKDDGVGFLPRSDSPGLGMGLPIIASLSDSLSIATAARGGTELSFTFNLTAPDPAQ